jgi:polyhydroxybutyrate depolymerase
MSSARSAIGSLVLAAVTACSSVPPAQGPADGGPAPGRDSAVTDGPGSVDRAGGGGGVDLPADLQADFPADLDAALEGTDPLPADGADLPPPPDAVTSDLPPEQTTPIPPASTVSGCGQTPIPPGADEIIVNVADLPDGGVSQRYITTHLPPGYSQDTPVPVVLMLHTFFEGAANVRYVTRMNDVSDEQGFIVAYPQGHDETWAAGNCCGFSIAAGVDDVEYFRVLIDALSARYCLDPDRVFVAGWGNGGMMALRLGCRLGDRIAAIASVEGTFGISGCQPPRPVPLLLIHGNADAGHPYNPAVPDTVATWVGLDGCTDASPAQVYQRGQVTCDEYQTCAGSSAVQLCTVDQGMGYWPGGVDDTSTDLDASRAVTAFFAAHPRP